MNVTTVTEDTVTTGSSTLSVEESSVKDDYVVDDTVVSSTTEDDKYAGMSRAEIKARKKAERMGYKRYMRKKMLEENDSVPEWLFPQDSSERVRARVEDDTGLSSTLSYLDEMLSQQNATIGSGPTWGQVTTINPSTAYAPLGTVSVAGFLAIFGSAVLGKSRFNRLPKK